MHQIAVLASLIAGLSPPAAPTTSVIGDIQAQAETPAQEDRYQVFLLTMDQGDNVWEQFGHNAILIRDRTTGQDLAWNWGLFNFEDEDFLPRFLRGTMLYSMGPSRLESFLDAYRIANRTVYTNEILLTQPEAGELDRLVRQNFEPENRDYVYHYFRDNCSTRARDVLDTILSGGIAERFGEVETSMSYRWHTRRLIQETTWIDQGLSFLLGTRGDATRTEWDAMFIPMEMMRLLEEFERADGAGGTAPLLGPRAVLVQADRAPARGAPPSFSLLWLVLGLGCGGVVLGLAHAARGGGVATRAALAGAVCFWGVFAGFLGSLLVSAWFTDHDFIVWNANILQLNPITAPLAAIAGVAFFRDAWWYGTPGRTAKRLAFFVAVLSVLAGILQLATVIRQGNGEVLAVAIPMNVAIAIALARSTRRAASAD